MPYYADLTKFHHPDRDGVPGHTVVTVVWLSESYPFATGAVAEKILDKISRLVEKPVHLARDVHIRRFCPAPVMIYHYLKIHGYCAPQEFLAAVARA